MQAQAFTFGTTTHITLPMLPCAAPSVAERERHRYRDVLTQARRLRALGFSVIPIDHPDEPVAKEPKQVGKTPVIRWQPLQHNHPTDADLRLWFGNGRQRNVAIVAGAISGMVFIDADSPEAVAWVEKHLPLTPIRTRTARGGHFGYRHPGTPVKNGVKIREGVDLRGDGGYVIAPGSTHHTGALYIEHEAWPDTLDAVPVFDPSWLVSQQEPAAHEESQVTVSERAPSIIVEGGRNKTLFREGCRLRRLGFDEQEILAALTVMNQRRCTPPLADDEVETTARSCARYEPAIDTFPTTDTGNAEFFASVAADKVRYDHGRRLWFVFDGNHWRDDRTGEVDRLALDAIRARQAAAIRLTDSGKKAERTKWAVASESRQRREHLTKLSATIESIAVSGKEWDTDPWVLGVRNGLVDLHTGKLREGQPDDRVTKVAPVAYDPNARAPRWERFVREIFRQHPELADYMQRVFGYTLTGDTGEQVFWTLYGEGANGKTTLIETLMKDVWGPAYAWTMPFPTANWSNSMSEYQKASLAGQRFLAASEVTGGARLHEELIKTLTGGDTVNARHPYGRPFEFEPVGKVFLRVNDKPKILDQSHGMWRRVKVVPFLEKFGVDPHLRSELAAEAEGILAWAVRGCLDWQRDGLRHPAVVEEATQEYREENDTVARFIAECCVVTENAKVKAGELFAAYTSWCNSVEIEQDARLSSVKFGTQMKHRFESEVNRHQTTYRGIGLRDDAPAPGGLALP